ncbi:deoxyribonucleotide triphosphate pyrophosphatase [Legionella geestiana]|uniref:dITP/XTP pyrophosphatase n=1 Tax=Legionella geestiana TaxID=45065 RepID=A0A0W0U4U3_9GAMM|nr:RdgB/HAM1 family non-canonical purine NTP pyrophosphatase [Legionella geestiana]KTD03075.1 deoxyribonucleotide triphosphate pyrophosphatase [Legionella geestiana]QBS12983.1 RdgB/HAM1 family non-canonical purine NTP pyrophosphatase [Legionella geestiana]QDQ39337.1 RdgB/HAM1 family non-canonical purine NTP pyrophosphatase [Legionella geestiana]STX54510.1 ribosomal protein Ham1 [Legionella geestiana]
MHEIILATGNAGKVAELQALLAPIDCIPQKNLGINDVPETGMSFIENALIKARHASSEAQRPALADDSGLVVPALEGAPGIFSARFAGPGATDAENIALLLERMHLLKGDARAAFFYCAIVIVRHANDPTPLVATGVLHGMIADTPRGTHGFGYDPVFMVPGHHLTAAELAPGVKNTISHRARALLELQRLMTDHPL